MKDHLDREAWMPVFVVVPARRTVTASVDEPNEPARESGGADFRQRIGTATLLPTGEISVELFALPTSGRMVIRKPEPGEAKHPWREE